MKPRVGVSACLLGERVRYDGGHKQQPWAAKLADRFEWVRVCPEVELGLGVPRETIQLEAAGSGVALVATQTRRDLTKAMASWAAGRVEALANAGLDGYVFKARSPSCGLGTAPVAGSAESRDGLFAEAVRNRLPLLPLADEETLAQESPRARFGRLTTAHCELRMLFHPDWTRGDVVGFHTRRKLLLLAYSPQEYAELGGLVGGVAEIEPRDFQARYAEGYLRALADDPAPGRHANALAHAVGYFSTELTADERRGLTAAIDALGGGRGEVEPLKARILGCARRFDQDYLLQQIYLQPCKFP